MAGRSYALTDDRPEMKSAREYNRQINIIVGQEDVQLLKWSAEGMRSSAYNGAIMSDLEVGTAAFHNQLRSTVPVALLDSPPLPAPWHRLISRWSKKINLTIKN